MQHLLTHTACGGAPFVRGISEMSGICFNYRKTYRKGGTDRFLSSWNKEPAVRFFIPLSPSAKKEGRQTCAVRAVEIETCREVRCVCLHLLVYFFAALSSPVPRDLLRNISFRLHMAYFGSIKLRYFCFILFPRFEYFPRLFWILSPSTLFARFNTHTHTPPLWAVVSAVAFMSLCSRQSYGVLIMPRKRNLLLKRGREKRKKRAVRVLCKDTYTQQDCCPAWPW